MQTFLRSQLHALRLLLATALPKHKNTNRLSGAAIAMARILFFHGLESGCGGRKHRFLEEHYEDVVCVDMHMSLLNLRKRNGILRNVLVNALFTAPWNLYAWSVQKSLAGCLQCQEEELAKTDASKGVLIGSSWGGAVATLAIAKGLWTGPTILIAPAYKLAVGKSQDPDFSISAIYSAITHRVSTSQRIIIVHGSEDETVPIADSREMAAAIGAEFLEIHGGDHRMRCLMEGENPQLISLIEEVQHPKSCDETAPKI